MKRHLKALLFTLPVILVACGGDDDNNAPQPTAMPTTAPTTTPTPMPTVVSYTVTVVNTTNNQPLSPVALVVHDGSFIAWEIGAPASIGLEQLAEGGSPLEFIAGATDALTTMAGAGPIGPGGNASFELTLQEQDGMYLSVASMLVNTNDAFSGSAAIDIDALAIDDYVKVLAPIYDAGTETNDELAANIPGPAGGGAGEGFNAVREARDIVTRHPGVVTQAHGYAESGLDESHRFDQGGMLITVVRTQ